MAIKYEEVRERVLNNPLTDYELKVIDYVEKYLDERIVNDFEKKGKSDIWILDDIIEFRRNPNEGIPFNHAPNYSQLNPKRKGKMSAELRRRFEEAGWVWKHHQGEDDGPNRPAMDYWILKGA